jgi:hypothetical protein
MMIYCVILFKNYEIDINEKSKIPDVDRTKLIGMPHPNHKDPLIVDYKKITII